LLKTVVLSWLVTVVTVCIFTFSIIPQQKRSLLDSLKSKAELVTTSIADVAASAIVIEDYSAVVDHCIQIVGDGQSVLYIVVTRNDGFSLIHRTSGWESKEMRGRWTPGQPREPEGGIAEIPLAGQEVYHYSHPFDYSGIEWGWIHVGLSLDQYNAEAEAVYLRTALLGLTCVLIGLLATIFYARRLVKPLHALTDTTRRVASGDLSARAQIASRDEIEDLGHSFNHMTESLQRTHNELSASKEYTDNIIQSMNDMLLVISSEGVIQRVNTATCELLGYEEEEIIGQRLDKILFEGSANDSSWDVTSGYLGRQRNIEKILVAKDGEKIPVLFSSSAMTAPDGNMEGFVCVALDIRIRKKEERRRRERQYKLKRQQESLAQLAGHKSLHSGNLHAAMDLITATAAKTMEVARTNIWLYNQEDTAMECVASFASDSAKSLKGEMLRVEEYPTYFSALVRTRSIAAQDAMKDPRTREFGIGFLNPEGISSLLDSPIRVRGKVVGVICQSHVGDKRNWSLEDQNYSSSLADLAALALEACDRHRTQEELKQAKEASETANKAKSQFLANMSHEIRTPMNGVIGMLRLLQRTTLQDKQFRYVETASASADALLTVIVDILDFSKIEAGKLEIESIDFDIWKTVETAVQIFGQRSEEKGLELACVVDPNLPRYVRGDPIQLQQIIRNLVANAIKFTNQGEVIVRVGIEEEDESSVTVRCTVLDTGIGIAEEHQGRLFRAFSQADTSTTRKYGGSGLGLVICRELVALMSGTIGVESTCGEGSTFWFTSKLEKQASDGAQPMPSATALRGLRVLVVDDNRTNREILLELSHTWGFIADEAANARQALDMLYAAVEVGRPYRIVITDRKMPEMDGKELGLAIKDSPDLSTTTLIMLDSVGLHDDKKLRELGFAAVLSKPLRQSELFNAIVNSVRGVGAKPIRKARGDFTPEARPEWRGKRILLAEDNAVNQDVALEMLRSAGYDCECVANGKDALEAITRGSYDLVFMDCQMPEMDGFEATTKIREYESDCMEAGGEPLRIPVIALTAHAMKGDREQCLAAGMDDYLSKPLDPDRVIGTVEKWLDSSHPDPQRKYKMEGSKTRPVEKVTVDSSSNGDPIDYKKLLKQWNGKSEFVETILQTFNVEAKSDLGAIEQALSKHDAKELADCAHRLKGAAATIGAEAMRQEAALLEAMGRDGRLGDAPVRVKKLAVEYERYSSHMAQIFATAPMSS